MALTHTSGFINYQITSGAGKTVISAQHEKFHKWSVEIGAPLSLCDVNGTIKIELMPITIFDIFQSKLSSVPDISGTVDPVWSDICFPTDCESNLPLIIRMNTHIQHINNGTLGISLTPVPITDSERLLMLIESLEKRFNKKICDLTNQLQSLSKSMDSLYS